MTIFWGCFRGTSRAHLDKYFGHDVVPLIEAMRCSENYCSWIQCSSLLYYIQPATQIKMDEQVLHKGSCHCKKVTFEILHSADLDLGECNCSICYMKGTTYVSLVLP